MVKVVEVLVLVTVVTQMQLELLTLVGEEVVVIDEVQQLVQLVALELL